MYTNLITYICEIFSLVKPSGLMLKQIKEYVENLNYSYGGIQYTLWYLKEILNKSFEVKYGIAQVKYYYEQAENYYKQQEQIENSIEELKENETKMVKVKIDKNVNKSICLIDIDSIL